MQRLRFTRVLILVCSALAMACTGRLEDGSADPAATTPAAKPPATNDEPASDPGDENEGEDPYFADPPPADSDAGASDGSSDAASDPPAADAPAAETGSEPVKPVLGRLADEAAREMAVMKISTYDHTTFIDEASGTFKFDCSGFVGYALTRVLPTHFAAVKTFGGVTRPLAKHYEQFFASIAPKTVKSGWSRVSRAIDLKPGDVIAWLKPADLVSENTGHVMIVRGQPTVNPKRADEIIIPVTDSTASFHGPTDTRSPSGDGLGNGPIGVIVDSAGAPLRYRWTGAYSTKEYSTAITFGRPE